MARSVKRFVGASGAQMVEWLRQRYRPPTCSPTHGTSVYRLYQSAGDGRNELANCSDFVNEGVLSVPWQMVGSEKRGADRIISGRKRA